MSKIAVKLFDETNTRECNYTPLLNAIFGEAHCAASEKIAEPVREALLDLCESNPFGALQMYFAEAYFLHGKSKEEIGKEIAANVNLLVDDLEHATLRFLRHPDRSKALAQYINKEGETDG